MSSFVYLIKGHGMTFKIGRTNDVNRRFRELQTASHAQLTLVDYCPGGSDIEKSFHRTYKDCRGATLEWFTLTKSQCFDILTEMSHIKLEASQKTLNALIAADTVKVSSTASDSDSTNSDSDSTDSYSSDSEEFSPVATRKNSTKTSSHVNIRSLKQTKSALESYIDDIQDKPTKKLSTTKTATKKSAKSSTYIPEEVQNIINVISCIDQNDLLNGEYTIAAMKNFYLGMNLSCPTGKDVRKIDIINDLIEICQIDFTKLYSLGYKVDELKTICRSFKLPVSGTKSVLVNSICKYLNLPQNSPV